MGPTAPLQNCGISVLNQEYSLVWKVGAELLLGSKFFFPIQKNISLVLGTQ